MKHLQILPRCAEQMYRTLGQVGAVGSDAHRVVMVLIQHQQLDWDHSLFTSNCLI